MGHLLLKHAQERPETAHRRGKRCNLSARGIPNLATDASGDDVTELLEHWRAGSAEAEAALMNRVHRELRKLAASYMRRERGGMTLEPTAVVHEAYIRLLPQKSIRWENRAHFYGIAARMMRRVLVDHARRKRAVKRDGLATGPISISRVPAPRAGADEVDVLDLHDALTDLAALDPRQAEVVEKRYFGGLTIEEIAEAMDISPATVKRRVGDRQDLAPAPDAARLTRTHRGGNPSRRITDHDKVQRPAAGARVNRRGGRRPAPGRAPRPR